MVLRGQNTAQTLIRARHKHTCARLTQHTHTHPHTMLMHKIVVATWDLSRRFLCMAALLKLSCRSRTHSSSDACTRSSHKHSTSTLNKQCTYLQIYIVHTVCMFLTLHQSERYSHECNKTGKNKEVDGFRESTTSPSYSAQPCRHSEYSMQSKGFIVLELGPLPQMP